MCRKYLEKYLDQKMYLRRDKFVIPRTPSTDLSSSWTVFKTNRQRGTEKNDWKVILVYIMALNLTNLLYGN